MEVSARLEEIKVPLPEPLAGHEELSAVLGIPEWWPTGSRVAIVLAHGTESDLNDPIIERIATGLTERKFLTLRFNFPFAEGRRRKKVDSPEILQRAMRAAIAVLGRDPAATPAHLFLGGVGLGAQVAADLTADLLSIEGACLLGYPLHDPDDPDTLRADSLFRIVSPMLFVQGQDDPTCQPQRLQRALARVGAPTTLHVSKNLGQNLEVLAHAREHADLVRGEVFEAVSTWLSKTLNEE